MADLNPILAMIQQANTSLQGYADTISDASVGRQKASYAQEDATKTIVAESNKVDTQKNQALLDAQNNTQIIAAAFGGKLGDPNELIGSLAQTFQQNTRIAQEQQKKIAAIDNTNIITDPLSWLQGQFTINHEIQIHNDADSAATSAAAAMNTINNITQESARSQLATAQTLTSDSIASDIKAKVAQGALEVAKIQHVNMRENIQDLEAMRQGSQLQLANSLQGVHLEIQAETLAQSRAAFEQSRQEHAIRMQQYQDVLDAKAATEAEIQQDNAIISAGAGVYGKPPVSSSEYKRMQAIPALKPVLESYRMAGLSKATTGRVVYGIDPASSAKNLIETQADLRGSTSYETIKHLFERLNDASKNDNLSLVTSEKGKQEQIGKNLNDLMVIDQKRWDSNAERAGSLYKAAPISEVVIVSKRLRDTNFFSKVLAPIVQSGTAIDTSPTALLSVAQAAISSGQLTQNELASGLHTFYSEAVRYNNGTRKLDSIGLQPQSSYNVVVKNPLSFIGLGNDVTFDMTRPEQVQKFVLAHTVAKEIPNIKELSFGAK